MPNLNGRPKRSPAVDATHALIVKLARIHLQCTRTDLSRRTGISIVLLNRLERQDTAAFPEELSSILKLANLPFELGQMPESDLRELVAKADLRDKLTLILNEFVQSSATSQEYAGCDERKHGSPEPRGGHIAHQLSAKTSLPPSVLTPHSNLIPMVDPQRISDFADSRGVRCLTSLCTHERVRVEWQCETCTHTWHESFEQFQKRDTACLACEGAKSTLKKKAG
jgi:transcriptional regulator with XRE-family HTH domain